MSLRWSSCIGQTLKLQGSDDIRAGIIGILTELVQLDHIKAGSHNNRTVLSGNDLILLGIVNGSGRTDLSAETTFASLEFDAVLTIDNRNPG